MPAATRYSNLRGTPVYKANEDAWRKEIMKRRADDKLLWDYYDGDMPDIFKPSKDKVNDNVKVNLIELTIEKGASALMGSDEVGEVEGIRFEIGGQDEAAETETPEDAMGATAAPDPEEWLEEFWEDNKKGIMLHDLATNGGICGHVFMKLNPRPGKTPQLINLNPSCVGVFWDEQDMDRVLWYRIEHETTRQDIVRQVSADGSDAGSWRIYNYIRDAKSGMLGKAAEIGYQLGADTNPWKPSSGDGNAPAEIPWPYEWAPIIDWKNLPRPNRYYGKNDIGQNWRLNDMYNAILSYIMRTLKIFTQPRTIMTGAAAEAIKPTAVNELWSIDNPEAKVYNLEMQSDLSAARTTAADAQRGFWNAVREIDSSMVQDKLGDMTNFDLRVLFRDALGKLTTKRLTYGDGLKRLCQYALELGGFPEKLDVNVIWPDPLPNDPVQQVTALEKDVTVGGLSKDTYLERRGYDVEKERLANEEARANAVHDQGVIGQGATANMLEAMGRLIAPKQPPRLAMGAPAANGNGGGQYGG